VETGGGTWDGLANWPDVRRPAIVRGLGLSRQLLPLAAPTGPISSAGHSTSVRSSPITNATEVPLIARAPTVCPGVQLSPRT
jgi:hypothetical protein